MRNHFGKSSFDTCLAVKREGIDSEKAFGIEDTGVLTNFCVKVSIKYMKTDIRFNKDSDINLYHIWILHAIKHIFGNGIMLIGFVLEERPLFTTSVP